MKLFVCSGGLAVVALGLSTVLPVSAEITLLAAGSLTQTHDGADADLSGLTYNLENGKPANLLGGLGSGLTFASGNTFLALPDLGPNATSYASAIDDTTSYINRFHTITMELNSSPNNTGLPFTLIPRLQGTTLLWSATPLVYGTGSGLGVGSGVPPVNNPI